MLVSKAAFFSWRASSVVVKTHIISTKTLKGNTRLATLEAWKEDFINYTDRWESVDEKGDDEELVARKAAMLEFLDELIVETLGRMRGWPSLSEDYWMSCDGFLSENIILHCLIV